MQYKVLALGILAALGTSVIVGCNSSSDTVATVPPAPEQPAPADTTIALSKLGQYQTGLFDQSAAEIVKYDAANQNAYVVNAASGKVDILNLSNPAAPTKVGDLDGSDIGGAANSVSIYGGVIAVAIEAATKQDPGAVLLFDASNGQRLNNLTVGALPDALTFTPDGKFILVANEGEPNSDYTNDPVGSISVIDMQNGAAKATVKTADFTAFNGQEDSLRQSGVRIYGPNATAAQDFEPEWITVTADSKTAYVSLQENNAIAVVDIATATVNKVLPLGFKDWNASASNGLDASDKDDKINIQKWPVYGMYQPDTIEVYETNGQTYLVTANEGDSRDYDAWTEEFRVKDLQIDGQAFPNAATLQLDENLGRLGVTSTMGVSNDCNPSDVTTDVETACSYSALYTFGGRSMSVFQVTDTGLKMVFDTGSQMEQEVAKTYAADFNSNNDENDSFDKRSDNKGPEPEGLALGQVDGKTYAFVGLERQGGLMVYDITNPEQTQFVQYITTRDFALPNEDDLLVTSDLGPEGVYFIPSDKSPEASKKPMVLVGYEVSGTTGTFEVNVLPIK